MMRKHDLLEKQKTKKEKIQKKRVASLEDNELVKDPLYTLLILNIVCSIGMQFTKKKKNFI